VSFSSLIFLVDVHGAPCPDRRNEDAVISMFIGEFGFQFIHRSGETTGENRPPAFGFANSQS
jgi:hypothetical protein